MYQINIIRLTHFRHDKNQQIQSLVTPLMKSVANVGSVTLPASSDVTAVSKLVGSVRVRVAGSSDSNHVTRRSVDGVVR